MTVSAIGSSQSLDLVSLLATKRRASSTGASSGGDAATDSLSLSLTAQAMARPQGSNPFQTDLENLGKLIDSGDLSGAKKAYAALQEKMQAHRPAEGGDDPLAGAFTAIGEALDSGDETAAKTAFQSLQTQLASLGAPGAGQSGSNPFEQDLTQLGKRIDSGDLSGAKALFQTMQARMKAHQPPPQEGSQNGGRSALSAIGTALDAGDLSSTQSAWSGLMDQLQQRSATSK
ncbi:MAG: hypothetical protein HY014_10035 [Acidobacteria bacterium]|nr:hypothetical protein [Acidobacteriota bacterium]MBI3488494.1 hypothetical protein [Acidobacteriota bacterium]